MTDNKPTQEEVEQAVERLGVEVADSVERNTLKVMIYNGLIADVQTVLASHAELTARLAEVGKQLEFDRTKVAECITAAKKAVSSRDWLTEGRGPYKWNDDNWHKEFMAAAEEFLAALKPLAKIAADWSNCPTKPEAIAQARIDLEAERDSLKRDLEPLGCGEGHLRVHLVEWCKAHNQLLSICGNVANIQCNGIAVCLLCRREQEREGGKRE